MTPEPSLTKHKEQRPKVIRQGGGLDAVYGIGLIGAWVYYFRRASTAKQRVQAFFKGLVWPAFLVYEVLEFLDRR